MSEQRKYFGDWDNWEQMKGSWCDERVPPDAEVLVAEYTYEDYSGAAFVLFEHDGKLFENHGGHCSCYGIEDQWAPEETTWPALAMRKWLAQTDECKARLGELIAQHQ